METVAQFLVCIGAAIGAYIAFSMATHKDKKPNEP